MKRIMKDTLVSIALLTTLFSAPSYAQSCGADSCLPCGEVITNNPGVAYEAPVTPYANYMATSSCCRNPNNYFGGFYAGAAYGIGVTNYHLQVANSTPTGLDSTSRSYLVGLANVGFDLVVNYFSLAIEAGYDYRSRNDPVSYFDVVDNIIVFRDTLLELPAVIVEPCKVRFDINSQHSVTLDLLPGVAYKRFTAYLRLGVDQSKYNLERRVCFPTTTLTEAGFVATINDRQYVFAPPSRNITGFRLGAGFGVAASKHVSFHLNYIHTFANKQSFTPDISAILANGPVILPVLPTDIIDISMTNLASKITIEPQRDEVNFGVRFTL